MGEVQETMHWKRWLYALVDARKTAKVSRELRALTNAQLADIGMTSGQVDEVARGLVETSRKHASVGIHAGRRSDARRSSNHGSIDSSQTGLVPDSG